MAFGDFVLELAEPPGTSDYGLAGTPPDPLGTKPWRGHVESRGSGSAWIDLAISETTGKWEVFYGVVTDGTPLDTLTRAHVFRRWDGTTLHSDGSKNDWQPGDGTLKVYPIPAADMLELTLADYRGTSRPPWAKAGTRWVDTTGAPTNVVWKYFDGANDIPFWAFNETANTSTPAFQVSATQRLIGRFSAGAGGQEEGTFHQVLDWIGSTKGALLSRDTSLWTAINPSTAWYPLVSGGAGFLPSFQHPRDIFDQLFGNGRGSILTRQGNWAALVAGTSGFFLKSQGPGSDLIWAAIQQPLTRIIGNGSGLASIQAAGIPGTAQNVFFFARVLPSVDTATVAMRLLDSGGNVLASVTSGAISNNATLGGSRWFGAALDLQAATNKNIMAIHVDSGGAVSTLGNVGGSTAAGTQMQALPSTGDLTGYVVVFHDG